MDKKNIAILFTTVIALGIGFFGGYKYRDSRAAKFQVGSMEQNRQFGGRNQMGNAGTGQMRTGFRPTMGEIVEINDKTITIKTENGGSKVLVMNDTTTVNKSTKVERSELKVGIKINVFGQDSSDGTVNANMIQLISLDSKGESPTPIKK